MRANPSDDIPVPPSDHFDIAILTIIPVEFRAVRQALKIDSQQQRRRVDGTIFYEATIYSRLLQRNLRVIVGCDVDASQSQASAMTMKIINHFDPAMIVLVGIGAGMRSSLKIGEVVVPRRIADLTTTVQTATGELPRPDIIPWPHAVSQMMPGFELDLQKYHARCRELFGPQIIAPVGQETEFDEQVTFTPTTRDYVIGSADVLRKDASEFDRLRRIHEAIRAADMESAGFIKACAAGLHPRPWLVVRGISDFGDQFKHDRFHSLASCAAAAWLTFFLEDGFDLDNLRPGKPPSPPVPPPAPGGASVQGGRSLTASVVEAHLERLSGPLTQDRLQDLNAVRETWRTALNKNVLTQVRALKARADWALIEPQARAKVLRFEASVVLAVEKDIVAAKAIAKEAEDTDRTTNLETLNTLIVYHERGARAALEGLAAPTSLDSWNLRLGLLAENDAWNNVLDESSRPPPGVESNAETHRLRALAYLARAELAQAHTEIEHALSQNPLWFYVRAAAARIDYYESLSAPLFARASKKWPEPTDPTLVRRDAAARAAVRRAEATLSSLLSVAGLDGATRRDLEGWRLACLANDPERRNDAQAYCQTLLESDPTHPAGLAWGAARNYISDFGGSIDALYAELLPKK